MTSSFWSSTSCSSPGSTRRISAPISAANSSIMSSLSDWVAVTISPACMRNRTTSAAVRLSFGPRSSESRPARRQPRPRGPVHPPACSSAHPSAGVLRGCDGDDPCGGADADRDHPDGHQDRHGHRGHRATAAARRGSPAPGTESRGRWDDGHPAWGREPDHPDGHHWARWDGHPGWRDRFARRERGGGGGGIGLPEPEVGGRFDGSTTS